MTSPTSSVPLPASRRDGALATTTARTHTIGVQANGSSMLGSIGGNTFCFGRYRLVVRERLLLKDNAPVSVGSRAFDLLLALVERAGETVNRQELFERVWPDVIVAKVNLRVHVAGLRKALGEGQDGNRFIVSVAGRGYRFVAPVSRLQSAIPAAAVLTRYSIAPLVCFVDLADVDDSARVAMAVAAALGCEVEPQQPLSRLLAYLQDKKILLAFDNCEHVFAGVAQLTERLFTEAPLVQILIGSRAALHLSHAFAPEK